MLTLKSYYGQINAGNNITTSPWTSVPESISGQWQSVTYGNGLFVAVQRDAIGNPVMTSPNGITWTSRVSASDNNWQGVTYGNGLFVAVSFTGVNNRVMTSPDGITWTSRTSAADNNWWSVTYGNGLFVAVAQSGTNNRVMTSPDGITWTIRTSAANNQWYSVTYGNGLFVAVSITGTNNRVMTSLNGITWTIRTSAADNSWWGVTYGNGLFVAVSNSGTVNGVMTSPDGITWTSRTTTDNSWRSVTYGNGLFVAGGTFDGTYKDIMTSPDGITWTRQDTPRAVLLLTCITYGNGLFVAISTSFTITSQGNVGLPLLTYDTSTKLVTSSTSLPISSQGATGSVLPNVFYNPSTASLSYGNVNTAGNTGDIFTLAAQEFGSTIKCNNVMVPNISRINEGYTLTGNNTSAMYTTTVYAPVQTTVTGVTFYQQTQGNYTANNNTNRVGLYQFVGATGSLLASSIGATGLYAQPSGTFFSQPFSAPITIFPGEYVIAFVYSNSATTTAPTLGGLASTTDFPNLSSFNMTNGAMLTASKTTQTTMPTTILWSELTVTAPTTPYLWAVLY